ncbi:dTDP-4-amino-4,6-dideoxygalactose transaminase [Herbiconiux sp.]|uniref:dTDP-4-amino-4,6-dideoxygalactose transaminase n=1 Tax=Herbiconiux sp. TaxID=1871186 RepID=UPI0025B957C3|nr:dTDP-4-amino-4,6-dideoxygalactose transaminase [Herbiconiux sp.]
MNDDILFSRPFRAPGELANLDAVLSSDHAHGDGAFTEAASARLRELTGSPALLTTSCTHALELTALLLEIEPGDEVVLPSFTFSSAAIAVVARGAVPVFADLDESTGNIDPESLAAAITPRTRAVTVMHYGGVPVDLEAVEAVTGPAGIPIVEDNAHGLGGLTLDGRRLGTVGAFGTQSFHDTKNVHCGEGGALLVNEVRYLERAEILREKGTNRARFLRGEIDKYTWQDAGSSYLPSELNAAVLEAQLAAFDEIQANRLRVWAGYAEGLASWAASQGVRLMSDDPSLRHTSHLFWLQLPTEAARDGLLAHLRALGIRAAFHYVPLHSSPAGRRLGRTAGTGSGTDDAAPALERTDRFASHLVRLPLWAGLTDAQVERVVDGVRSYRVSP